MTGLWSAFTNRRGWSQGKATSGYRARDCPRDAENFTGRIDKSWCFRKNMPPHCGIKGRGKKGEEEGRQEGRRSDNATLNKIKFSELNIAKCYFNVIWLLQMSLEGHKQLSIKCKREGQKLWSKITYAQISTPPLTNCDLRRMFLTSLSSVCRWIQWG